MAFWDDVLALSPEVAWMADETSGTVATDDTGNGHDGTYTGAVYTQGEASLIANHPEAASVLLDGTDVYIAVPDAAALDVGTNDFTAIVTVKPTDLATQRDIIGKIDTFQIWLETSGRITGYFTPAWTAVLSSNDAAGKLVAGTAAFLVIRQDGSGAAEASVWIGHPGGSVSKVGSTTKSSNLSDTSGAVRMGGSSTGANRSFKGHIQAFAYWPNTALSDANISSLFSTWDTTPTPTTPDAPTISKPTASQTFSNSMLVTVVDGADTGEYGTLEYMVEANINGAGYSTIIDWTETRPVDYLIDVSAYAEGTTILRAYMRRSVSTVSDASATVSVTIDHDANTIATPTIEWVWGADLALGFYASAFSSGDPAPVAKSIWQFDEFGNDFASPLEVEHTGDFMRVGISSVPDGNTGWKTANLLTADTDYECRMKYEDANGDQSEWSVAVRGKTASDGTGLIAGGSELLVEDFSGNANHGKYVQSCSSGGVPVCTGPSIPYARFPYYLIEGTGSKLGAFHDNQELVVFTGTFPDAGGTCPQWRMYLKGYLHHEPTSVGFGVMGLNHSTGTPLQVYQKESDGHLYVSWAQSGGGFLTGGEIDLGAGPSVGQEFEIELEWDGAAVWTFTNIYDGVTINDAVEIYNNGAAPMTLGDDIISGQIGHHSRAGPSLAGAYHMLFGVLLAFEFEWDSALELQYTFEDPRTPDAPTVTRA